MTTSPPPAGTYADRHLCSATHLSEGFAGHVLDAVTRPSLRVPGPSPGLDLVAVARHAGLAADRRVRRNVLLSAVLIGTALVAMAMVIVGGRSALLWLASLFAAGWAAAASILYVFRLAELRLAVRILETGHDPRELAPPLGRAAEATLAAAMNANVVVFSGPEPFAGAGERLARWKIAVTCTRPARPGGHTRPFTADELHKRLTLAARQAGIPGLEVHHRLFVAGTATGAVAGLHPGPASRPELTVSRDVLRAGIVSPSPSARTYLCLRKVSRGGDLVVEVFVRAERTAAALTIEHHAYVLLPLRPELCAAGLLPRGSAWRGAARRLPATVRETFAAPRVLGRLLRERVGRWRAYRGERRLARRVPVHDYGAATGLREEAASSERIDVVPYADEDRDLDLLRRALLEAVAGFLDEHDIDTADFDRQRGSIVARAVSIGALGNGTTVIGAGGPAGPQPAPSPRTAAPWASATSIP